jgi:hypothetical protein
LIGGGVMLPMMSLILLPLVSIFLTDLITTPLLVFIYIIFFPTVLLLMSMNFATNRIQVNTIDLSSSPRFKKLPIIVPFISILIIIVLMIPSLAHIATIDLSTATGAQREFAIESVFIVWLGIFGVAVGVALYCYAYAKRNEKLWNEMKETEDDLPHLLQLFSSYLSLNRSFESILTEIEDDYKKHGFRDHPITSMLHEVTQTLQDSKKSILQIMKYDLPRIVASRRVIEVFQRIVLFTEIDQKSAAKSAKMIRSQTLSIHKLDEYIKTLLAETISTVGLTITILAPLLATTATIMSSAIVQSLEFIKQQIGSVLRAFGGGELNLQLVDVQKIIPPTIVEFVVGLYFIETVIILSVFLSNVNYGTDKFKIAQTLSKNVITAMFIYTAILFLGHFIFTEIVFAGVFK